MGPIGKVVNNHQFADIWPEYLLPFSIESIVINDQPVGRISMQRFNGLLAVLSLGHTQMCGIIFSISFSFWRGGRQQDSNRHGLPLQQFNQVTRMCPADKMNLCATLAQGMGQCQTAHEMASAHAIRGIDSEDDFHALTTSLSSINASAIPTPTLAPRQRPRCSTAAIERTCGHACISC